jgi:hypothetical protein
VIPRKQVRAQSKRGFRALRDCRNSPRMPHNAFKKPPACNGMSRNAPPDFRWHVQIVATFADRNREQA